MSIPLPFPNINDTDINDVQTWSSNKILDYLGPALSNEVPSTKNLFDAEQIVIDSNHPTYVYIDNGYLRFITRDSSSRNFKFNIRNTGPLTFSGKVKSFSTYNNVIQIGWSYSDGTSSNTSIGTLAPDSELNFSFTMGTEGKTITSIYGRWTDDKEAGFDLSVTQLEKGTEATSFVPFEKDTIENILKERGIL